MLVLVLDLLSAGYEREHEHDYEIEHENGRSGLILRRG
jgi:hypothetical protein